MTSELDPRTPVVLSWLREGAPENAEHVLQRALAQVDTTPQRRSRRPAWMTDRANTYATLVAAAAAVLVVAIVGYPFLARGSWFGGPTATPAGDPRDAFLGTWVSTGDPGFGTRTMTVERRDERTVEVVVTDTIEAACDLTPSTMSGTGSVEGNVLVIPAPEYTCDDGSEPQALSGPTLNEDLRNLTYTRDPQTGTLWARDDLWVRPEVVIPGPTSNPIQTSDGMWPQSSLDEVREAQELADAGDPAYGWQVDARYGAAEAWDQVVEEGGPEIAERFIRDELGWESFLFAPFLGNDAFWGGGGPGAHTDLQYLRCAPGETNTLYPDAAVPDQIPGADRCAPTIDDLRYEVVSIDLAQPVRLDAGGIWVVSRSSAAAPFAQADSGAAMARVEERLEAFLQARVDGEGAEGYVDAFAWGGPTDVPLLYATTSGAPYQRYELELSSGPRWPKADLEYTIRLFAQGGDTVVEQLVSTAADAMLSHNVRDTTENGQPVPEGLVVFDGQVSVAAPSPWAVTGEQFRGGPTDVSHRLVLTRDEDRQERVEIMVDPLPAGEPCAAAATAADAAALARAIRSDPDLVATAPVEVTVQGRAALRMDVTAAPGATMCEEDPAAYVLKDAARHGLPIAEGSRIRLYLLDAPEGSSFRILAIAIGAPESSFESVADAAAPILETIELRVP